MHGCREIGKELFRKFLIEMNDHYDEKVIQLRVLSDTQKNYFSSEFEILGKYLKTATGLPVARGQNYRIPVGAFFEVKNNKITRITNYYNLNQWIEQVKK